MLRFVKCAWKYLEFTGTSNNEFRMFSNNMRNQTLSSHTLCNPIAIVAFPRHL